MYYSFYDMCKVFKARKRIESQFLTRMFMEMIVFSKNLERVKKILRFYLQTELHEGLVAFTSNPVYTIDNEEIPFPFLYFKASYSCFRELHEHLLEVDITRANNLKVYYRAFDQYCTNIANSLCDTRTITITQADCNNIIFLIDKIQGEVSSFLLEQYTK